MKIGEQSSSEVLSYNMELFGVSIQVSLELLSVFGLNVILLLLVSDVFELVVAFGAVSFAGITVNALVMIGVTTHKVNGWKAQLVVAAVALFGVEVFGLSSQVSDFFALFADYLHVVLDLVLVLAENAVLDLETIEEVLLDNLKFEVGLALEDFQHEEWAQDLFFGAFIADVC